MKGFGKVKQEDQAGEIDLTPMLDVVFILLIFFIVTSVFVKEAGYEVDKPIASMSEPSTLEPILIAITPLGEIWMGGDLVLERNLRLKIEQRVAETPNAGIIIQADQEAPNSAIIAIMAAAREADVGEIEVSAEE